jgi:hypothetical protein
MNDTIIINSIRFAYSSLRKSWTSYEFEGVLSLAIDAIKGDIEKRIIINAIMEGVVLKYEDYVILYDKMTQKQTSIINQL